MRCQDGGSASKYTCDQGFCRSHLWLEIRALRVLEWPVRGGRMSESAPRGRDELQVLQGLCHAFGSTADPDNAARAALRWIGRTVGDDGFAAHITRADAAGRLRTVASTGRWSDAGRKRSAHRRSVFRSRKPLLLDRSGAPGRGLLLLPLVARGESLGVVEIQASATVLRERMATLEAIASQTAIVLRGIDERRRLERERDARAEALELAADRVTLLSPEAAVEEVVDYCRRPLRMPIAGWRS